MHVTVMVALLLHSCSAQEQKRMTVVGIRPFQSEVEGQYQCHLSNPDFTSRDDGSVESFRTGWTKTYESSNPNPPQPVFRDRDTYPHYSINLNHTDNDDGFGVFGCRVKDGKLKTEISTVRIRSDADIRPSNGLFTQTVNIGDEGVQIRMESSRPVRNLVWRHNDSEKLQAGRSTFSIDESIQQYHAGIYECHVNRERNQAKHGLFLLLVRACPSNRWSPNCTGVCDSCYNGGICDESNGKCVCPPGFMGDNCLTACGGNKFGYECTKRCSSSKGEEGCSLYQFCLIHPFGCRCNSGWKGLACDTACDAGTFGASCLQSCNHCTSGQCDRYTGNCTGSDTSCKPGRTGDNCQECDGNFFGPDCSQECHCSKNHCNIESGLCKPGGCLPQWVDLNPPYSCQTGLQNISSTNAGSSAMVTCTAVAGPGGGLDSLYLFLSTDRDTLENYGITCGENFTDNATKMQTFVVGGVERGGTFYCQLRGSDGDMLAVLGPHTVDVFGAHVSFFAVVIITSVVLAFVALAIILFTRRRLKKKRASQAGSSVAVTMHRYENPAAKAPNGVDEYTSLEGEFMKCHLDTYETLKDGQNDVQEPPDSRLRHSSTADSSAYETPRTNNKHREQTAPKCVKARLTTTDEAQNDFYEEPDGEGQNNLCEEPDKFEDTKHMYYNVRK